ncbi:hypothetical protein GE09DRAFT_1232583 [Coniochaeta sp. 2T2.1]|nr:hypothetical protein GE09DRAFT_1232583 [Coniochaeta sp. 2T2.1]
MSLHDTINHILNNILQRPLPQVLLLELLVLLMVDNHDPVADNKAVTEISIPQPGCAQHTTHQEGGQGRALVKPADDAGDDVVVDLYTEHVVPGLSLGVRRDDDAYGTGEAVYKAEAEAELGVVVSLGSKKVGERGGGRELQALEHPSNPIHETGYQTQSKKSWLSDHPPINMKRTDVWTWQDENHDTQATFEPQLQPAMVDDEYRFALPAYPPNAQSWRFHSESDVAN